nr:MAG TPA: MITOCHONDRIAL IMPORT RECEPTOR SUBUNIT TOM20 PROTEIN IMPORT ACROSS OUTER [Caudoviricetes sp.]DAP29235.1 MAG TPA: MITOCHONDRIAL IMPORT RECEPTOR SUBUNIT TOM20 PROTEIN IMPORT ACROSS OUTER [Bacteriophage sp.]
MIGRWSQGACCFYNALLFILYNVYKFHSLHD